MSRDPALEQYFREAASWDADRAAMNARSVRIAWRVAIGAGTLSVFAVTALMLLMPLKRVEPFVIRVDNATGIVDLVTVFVGQTVLTETVTRYLLTHYVTVCERFSYATAESDYEECAAFHAPPRNQAWAALWDRANPGSPLNVYKDGSSVRAELSAVSFFRRANGLDDLAQIRYTKARRTGPGANDQVTHWIATIQYVYAEPPRDARVRRWNPLGFKIVEFRSEPELIPPGLPTDPAAQAVAVQAPAGGVR